MDLEHFQLIDRIETIDLGEQSISTQATVPTTSGIFEGHFPGHPLMPGVLLVEAMAQTAGWLIIAATRFERMALLAAIKQAKLRSFIFPGAALAVSARLAHQGSGFAVARAGIVKADGEAVCDAELMFRTLPFPAEETREKLRAAARRLAFPLELLGDA